MGIIETIILHGVSVCVHILLLNDQVGIVRYEAKLT